MFFDKICLPLLEIPNNIYAFLSGIFISCSTNIFTNLCFGNEKLKAKCLFVLAALSLAISGFMFILLATLVTKIENKIDKIDIDSKSKLNVIEDAALGIIKSKKIWVILYMVLLIALSISLVFPIWLLSTK